MIVIIMFYAVYFQVASLSFCSLHIVGRVCLVQPALFVGWASIPDIRPRPLCERIVVDIPIISVSLRDIPCLMLYSIFNEISFRSILRSANFHLRILGENRKDGGKLD